MRKNRFSEEQIIAILKGSEAGWEPRSCAGGTGSRGRVLTGGRGSSEGWK